MGSCEGFDALTHGKTFSGIDQFIRIVEIRLEIQVVDLLEDYTLTRVESLTASRTRLDTCRLLHPEWGSCDQS